MDASCSLGALAFVNLHNSYPELNKIRGACTYGPSIVKSTRREKIYSSKGIQLSHEPVLAKRSMSSSLLTYCSTSGKDHSEAVDFEENKHARRHVIRPEVESFVSSICETTSVAEVKLKLSGFELYVRRSGVQKDLLPSSPSAPPQTDTNSLQSDTRNQSTNTNGFPMPLATISNLKPSASSIERILATASDEGLVVVKSPVVGYFRRSRKIKGKQAPPACKEKQQVKEGRPLCYINQLDFQLAVKSEVAGEVVKILREDGEPVGYGDALIVILPSFPGIK